MHLHLVFKKSLTIHNIGVRDSGNSKKISLQYDVRHWTISPTLTLQVHDACSIPMFEPARSILPTWIRVEAKMLTAMGVKEIDI